MMFASVQDQAERLAQGTLRSVEWTETVLERAVQGEGPRVFTRVLAETARAEAQASDTLRAAGVVRSPIEGLPISIKDLFDVQGVPTCAGSQVLRTAAPATASAEVVQRLRRAGAVIVGLTNMTEFAFSGLGLNPHYGTPRNPWEREVEGGRIPGGSSSGAAVSVTDGMAAAAIGSDTGGSVRIPSALCGLTGFKPTARRVSMQGVLPLSQTLDSIGPLAPTVACCATLDAILSGAPQEPLPALPLTGLRLIAPQNYVLDGMDTTVAAAYERALSRLSAAGVRIVRERIELLDELPGINAQGGFSTAEAWAWHRELLQTQGEAYDPRVRARIERGAAISAADYIDLQQRRTRWIARMQAVLAAHDALVMPTVPVVAPRIRDLEASDEVYFAANGLILRNPSVINFLDGCAISLPCHRAGEAPVGLSLAAAGGHDRRVLAIAQAVEACLTEG